MHSDDSVTIEISVKPLQSPSTSWKPRQTHSIAHHKLLLKNCVLFSVDVKTGGDDCGIIQLSAVAVNLQTNKKHWRICQVHQATVQCPME